MPDLPEVETVRRGLQRLLPGLTITHVSTDNPKSFPNAAADVAERFSVGRLLESVQTLYDELLA